MKYKWLLRKHWFNWMKRDIQRYYYKIIHKLHVGGLNGTLIPTTGKGKYVSVFSKGEIIQIIQESGYEDLEFDEIKIIPCKENHGVMVERFKNGKMSDRNLLNLNQFNKKVIFASNVEEFTNH